MFQAKAEFQSATDLAIAIRAKRLSAREALDLCLARIERINPEINAVIALDREAALARAVAADNALARGDVWGPLHGVPMTAKDSIEVAGMPATAGAPEFKAYRPSAHAVAIQRLVDAGAIVFGKTNLPIYASDLQTFNALFGTTNNPWDPTRSPGGSSGGSAAALAAGLSFLEIGTDLAGSIRNPAHFCGVYGHKPSFGLVPDAGQVPPPPQGMSGADITVIGPLARSAEDLELALGVLAGPDADQAEAWRLELPMPRRAELSQYRLAAWLDDADFPVETEIRTVLEGAISALRAEGAAVDDRARPALPFADYNTQFYRQVAAVFSASFPAKAFAGLMQRAGQLAETDRGYDAEFVRGATESHRDWIMADAKRREYRRIWAEFFTRYDALLCPVMPTAAARHDPNPTMAARTHVVNGVAKPYWSQVAWCGLASFVYLPATVAPIGRTKAGLPVGIQIIGPYLGDTTTLDLARRLGEILGGFTPPPRYAT
ncbi:MAG: amidase [Alphaproteobacteria bacterium]